MPDFAGYSLCFMESPGVDYLCLMFEGYETPRLFLYLYASHIEEANFTCDPFFPATSSVTIGSDTNGRQCLSISFDTGQLRIMFKDFSFHVLSSELYPATHAAQRGA